MKILYKDPTLRYMTCQMNRGIRQGYPLSAILYLFVAEVLSEKIKKWKKCWGFSIQNSDKEIKHVQHADDMTLTLKNTLIRYHMMLTQ